MHLTTIRPRSLRIEASSFCQLRCPSCPTTSKAIHPAIGSGFLKFDDFKRLLEANPEVQSVELSNYGEIFLNPELLQILEFAHQRGIKLSAGNGVNLNHVKEPVLEGLAKYQFDEMTCSIDGASNETYSIYRVKGNFDRVIENIRKINDFKKQYRTSKPRMAWQFIVFGHNEHEIPKARAMAAELGMDFRVKLTWDSEFSPIKDREYVIREARVSAASREEFKENSGRDLMQRICHQLWDKPQINYDGKVLGCCRNFWGDFGSNAFEEGLEASINNEKMQYAREMLTGKAAPREDLPCHTCDIYITMQETGLYLDRGVKYKMYKALTKFYSPLKSKFRKITARAASFF